MKKLLLSLIFLLIANQLISQTAPKKPLFEMFRGAWCVYCAGFDTILDPLMIENEGTHSLIKYSTSRGSDAYYNDDDSLRGLYYWNNVTPNLFINGVELFPGEGPPPYTYPSQEIYDSVQNLTSSLVINITRANITIDSLITVNAELIPLNNYDSGLIANVAIVEKWTYGNITGWDVDTAILHTQMKMLPDGYGEALDSLKIGNTVTLSQSYDMDSTFIEDDDDLIAVVFVQDSLSWEVIQSEQIDVAVIPPGFNATFYIQDIEENPITGVVVTLDTLGILNTNEAGLVVFENVASGTYSYTVSKSEYLSAEGSIIVESEDVVDTVILEQPVQSVNEGFEEGIPDNWSMIVSGGDELNWVDGKLIFVESGQKDNTVMLISPELDLSQVNTIYFSVGDAYQSPILNFGYVTDPSDPATFSLYETYYPQQQWEQYSYDFAKSSNETKYLAWELSADHFCFFSLDDILFDGMIVGVVDYLDEKLHFYPNPFTTSTTIVYELKQPEKVTLTIYNHLGQLVYQTEENQPQGNQQLKWNAEGFAEGVYYYRLEVGDAIANGKLVKVR